jgi:hypothetical protein
MSQIHFHKTTTLSPEQFVAGLTDFGPDRENVSNGVSNRPGIPDH